MLVPLPSHPRYEVRHGEAVEDEAEQGGYGGAGGDDPEGGKEGKWLCCEAFAGGGDEGRDGVPCGEPAGEAFGAGGIDDGREEHPELGNNRNTAPDVPV